MARRVGFGRNRRSVLGRDRIEARAEEAGLPVPPSRRGFDWGMFIGFTLLLGVPLLFAVIGAYPAFDAMGFPDRAHEAEAQVTGRSSVQPPGEPERVTSITVQYETRIGARLTADIATTETIEIGETLIVFYDPEAPRTVRLSREVTPEEAFAAGGDRIYFTYFALGFIALVLVMLILVFAGRRKRA